MDADFINIMGLKGHGRDQIARGHDEILSTIFRHMRIGSTVQSIRLIRPDVAVADVTFTPQTQGKGPFMFAKSSAGLVVTKEGDSWSNVTFRNMIPFERPAAGPMERALIENAAKSK